MSKLNLSDLSTPILLVDYEKLENNIRSMAAKAKKNGVNLRPHIKTHKCIEIGKMQVERGAKGITVSTLGEAEIFAKAGFDDITYAVPISRNKIKKALELSTDISLKILVDSPAAVLELDKATLEVQSEIEVMVKVDCGYHRCGIDPKSNAAVNLVRRIDDAQNLTFKGILTHAGHSYLAKSVNEIKRIAVQEQQVMVDYAKILRRNGLPPEVISIGSTPTVALADTFLDEITEIRPGNYVFYDYTQVVLGTCKVSDCALTVLAGIVGIYSDRIVIDTGATALSKDQGPTHKIPNCGFGQVIQDYDNGILASGVNIDSLSQEHGKVTVTRESLNHFNNSDLIRILPNHSCLSANLFDKYVVIEDGKILDCWRTRCI
jgi:D-serine deaminase-like pyridoxal phosphate-dependent protein